MRSGLLSRERIAAGASGELPDYPALVARSETDAALVESLIFHRHAARSAKDWPRADAIRDELKRRGVALDDTPRGIRWRTS